MYKGEEEIIERMRELLTRGVTNIKYAELFIYLI